MSSSPHSSLFSLKSEEGITLRGEKWSSDLARAPTHSSRPVLLFIHQYTVMGGSRQLMAGMARHAATVGYEAVTFDLRGAGDSTGTCTFRNKSERADVLAMIAHLEESTQRSIFLVGSSAGAALAGSVLDSSPRIIGGLFVGYTWGWCASLLFGWAFASIKASTKPKMFVIGTADEFTSMAQYEDMFSKLKGELNEKAIIKGKNHFQIEGPEYDEYVVEKVTSLLNLVPSQNVEECIN